MGAHSRSGGTLILCWGLLSGCGDSDGDESAGGGGSTGGPFDDCELEVMISGAVVVAQSTTQAIACAYPDNRDSGVEIHFVPGGPLSSFMLRIHEILEGSTGAGFVASVGIVSGERTWTTPAGACTVVVDYHSFDATIVSEFGERTYWIGGSGNCSAPAAPDPPDTGAGVTIGPFRYAGLAVWIGDPPGSDGGLRL